MGFIFGSPDRARTCDIMINSHALYRLSYRGILCWPRPIFPDRFQSSIFGTAQLNFRVRNGNGWTLCVMKTNFVLAPPYLPGPLPVEYFRHRIA